MNAATIVLLSAILSFGAPLAFAVYEIVTMRRGRRGGDDRQPPQPPQPKPLPDCLQPRVLLARGRIRDDVRVD